MWHSLLICIVCLISFSANSLEIDEKLTLRILRLSKTKKTMLINRGLEDGLVVGDHAKFFVSSGVMARGVVVKASPTRSIWSVYRIIETGQFFEDKVINLKVSTPLKLTEDVSKSFRANVYANSNEGLNIPLAKGADDLGSQLTEQERKDLENLGGTTPAPVYTQYNMGVDVSRTLEIWTMMSFNSLSSNSEQGDTSSSSGSNTSIDFSIGIEKYFARKGSALGNLSISAHMHKVTEEVTNYKGFQTSLTALEGGVGMYYHFLAHPLSYGRLIGYVGGSLGVGTATDNLNSDSTSTTVSVDSDPITGSTSFFSIGTGFKYFLSKGFGGRILLDYYQRGETYTFDDDDNVTKVVQGPRVQFGFSYRW